MTAKKSSLLRRTILAATIVAFSFVLNAQDQSDNQPCQQAAEIILHGPMHYCINKEPTLKQEGEPEESFQKRWAMGNERLKLVHNLIELRFAVERIQASATDISGTSAEFEKLKGLIDPLCKPNFCASTTFTGFPPLVKMTRVSLLEFLRVAAARSVFDEATPGVIDMAGYSLRINQMQHAINLLINGTLNNEIAAR
jgi:hypothetical protein